MGAPVGIIAGRGDLPGKVARALGAAGRSVVMAGLATERVEAPDDVPFVAFRLERLGALFRTLRARGVTQVVFAGGIDRPRIDPRRFDLKTWTLLPRMLRALRTGDDSALRIVIDVFQREGFGVIGVHELIPELLPTPGFLTRAVPSKADRRDAERAAEIVTALSTVDIGQGAVVAQGVALAVETMPGTDRMLQWVADTAGAWRPNPEGARGVLFKGPKTGQERRADLPVIGPQTVAGARRAGLAGIVIAEGGVMILDQSAVVEACDAAGLFLWVRPAGEGEA